MISQLERARAGLHLTILWTLDLLVHLRGPAPREKWILIWTAPTNIQLISSWSAAYFVYYLKNNRYA